MKKRVRTIILFYFLLKKKHVSFVGHKCIKCKAIICDSQFQDISS